MIGYFDPDSLKVGDADGVISFINASDAEDIKEVRIASTNDAKRVISALKDQIKNGLAGLDGRFEKVQGTFNRLPGSTRDGIIVNPGTGKETPVRMDFDVKSGDLPARGLCVAIGEMIDGALMIHRMTMAPIAPTPVPNPLVGTLSN
ncbi:hypothetical protein [Pseudosulfitobacter pseudonitzschiae]|uniref:hypothetical protein n=1 Tax=Pseudosulfitobacter pseudonitzschiae TaxID=1402135 RepID=UPI003B7A97AB